MAKQVTNNNSKLPALMTFGKAFSRTGAFPLDMYEVWSNKTELEAYAKTGETSYVGQKVTYIDTEAQKVYQYSIQIDGSLKEIGTAPISDGATVAVDETGKLSLYGVENLDNTKTYVPSIINGVLTWAEPDTSTAEGQAQEINALKTRATALEETVNGKAAVGEEGAEGYVPAVPGLVEKVAALEAVDNATQDELDAYKEVVTAAIAAGVKEAKDYADAQDADTIYDDTALAARVKAIEDDYLVEADKYDDTELSGRVTTVEGKVSTLEGVVGNAESGLVKAIADEKARAEEAERVLGERIDGIDFVDEAELATALSPYAKTADVEAGLALKADKEAFENLKGTVEAFLTGDGTEAALDSLKELIEYIKTHDDVEISGILEDIQAIENKLVGIDGTVADYVTAAINALKIGDYAKAADLTALAGRVEDLEAKPFDTYATKTEVQTVDAKFANYTTSADLATQMAAKADAASVVDNDTFDAFKTSNTSAINTAASTAKSEAIEAAKTETESQVSALSGEVAETYATKTEFNKAVEDIESELTTFAKADATTAALDKKIETAQIRHTSDDYVEGVTKSGTELTITVDAYTKSEVYTKSQTDNQIDAKIASVTGGESAADVKLALESYRDALNAEVWGADATSWTTRVTDADGKVTVTYTPDYGKTSRVDSLESRVGAPADGETNAPASGLFASVNAINTNIDNIKAEIGVAKDTDVDPTGLYALIDTAQTKADKGVSDAAKVAQDLNTLVTSGQVATNKKDIEDLSSAVTTMSETVGTHGTNITTLTNEVATLKGADTAFTSKLGELEAEIDQVAADFAEADSKINSAIAANTAKFANYYTKGEADANITNALTDYSTTSQNDAKYATITSLEAIYKATEGAAATGVLADTISSVNTLSGKVTTLIGSVEGDDKKSVRDISAEEVSKIVAGADTSFDTLKEIADWIKNDETGAAKMNSDIASNKRAIDILNGDASTSGSVLNLISTYAPVKATNTVLGLVMGSTAENKVSVASDGTMEVNSVNVNKLVQTAGDTLILDGGNAALS